MYSLNEEMNICYRSFNTAGQSPIILNGRLPSRHSETVGLIIDTHNPIKNINKNATSLFRLHENTNSVSPIRKEVSKKIKSPGVFTLALGVFLKHAIGKTKK